MTAAPCRVHGIRRCTICPGLLVGAGGAFIPAIEDEDLCTDECSLCGVVLCGDCAGHEGAEPDLTCDYLAAGRHCRDCWEDCPRCAKEAHDEWEAEHR